MTHSLARRLFCFAFVSLCSCPLIFGQMSTAEPKTVFATIAGQPVYESDFADTIALQLQQLRNQENDIKTRGLETYINQKVAELEAKKKGVALTTLFDQEVNSKISEPTDGEVEAYYLGQRDRLNASLDDIKPQLRTALKNARAAQVRQDYFDRLRREYDVRIVLTTPRTEVSYDSSRVRGDSAAPVTIVEFSDFQCPFCLQAFPIIKQVLEKYPGKVKLAFRDFPLSDMHPQAQSAAEAARCAGSQGKFWEYHDALFSDPRKLDTDSLVERARTLKLDVPSFQSCLNSGKFKSAIEADVQAGTKANVSGTPTFFVNGIPLSGAKPLSVFQKTIDAELSRIDQHQPK